MGRSSSPPRAALHGLRADGPGRLERQFCGLPRVLDVEARARALAELDRDVLAATTQRTNAARTRTIEAALGLWVIPLWPPSTVAWSASCTLKLGRYASAPPLLCGPITFGIRHRCVPCALGTVASSTGSRLSGDVVDYCW